MGTEGSPVPSSTRVRDGNGLLDDTLHSSPCIRRIMAQVT